jgi:glycosyltransferase involved in cell wall biosynthesis
VDGFLIPTDDAATMATRMEKLLTNPTLNLEMGRQARSSIEQRYDEQVAGAVFVEMWDQMLDKKG